MIRLVDLTLFLKLFFSYKHYRKLLPLHGLKTDASQLVSGGVIAHRVGRAGIIYIAQFYKNLQKIVLSFPLVKRCRAGKAKAACASFACVKHTAGHLGNNIMAVIYMQIENKEEVRSRNSELKSQERQLTSDL